MSERVLPDDLDQWPSDPYELLGVPRDIGTRDLKRAYTTLLRQYKPEQKPDEFRRIREAYDTILQFFEWGLITASVEQGRQDAVSVVSADSNAVGPITDETDTFWRQALDGDPRAAYSGLCGLMPRFPQRADLPLRLYWIRTVFPEVDASGRATDWLIAAVREHGPYCPAGEMLHRELFEHPAETLASTAPLLDSQWLPAALVDFAQARWWAAMQLHAWMAIRSDLDLLRPRVAPIDEAAWLRLLCAAIDATVWHANEPEAGAILMSCRDEVRRLEHLAVRNPLLFDRLDYVLAVAPSWNNLRRQFCVPPSLADMIPLSWSAPFARIRPVLARLFGEIVAQPRIWLDSFDDMFMHALSVLDHIGNLFQHYQDRLESAPIDPHTPLHLATLLADFIAQLKLRNYKAMRAPILDFCLAESISAEMAAMVVPPIQIHAHGGGLIDIRSVIGRDLPLRLVCWAHRLFWA